MTNPYQRGGSGSGSGSASFLPDPSPHFGPRRPSSYATVASTTGPIPRLSGFAHLLNPVGNGDSYDPPDYPPSSRADMDGSSSRNGAGGPGTGAGGDHGMSQNGTGAPAVRYWQLRNPQLQPQSRAFEPFYRHSLYDGFGPQAQAAAARHFTPSYLKGSTYAQRLEESHRAKLAALREGTGALQSQIVGAGGGPGGIGAIGAGPHHNSYHHTAQHGMAGISGGSGGGAGFSAAKLAAASHRGVAFDVAEKLPGGLEAETPVTPLPTRWNKDDKWGGLEVLADGLEVKLTGPKGPNDRERDHEACSIRADHYMPHECGIYYYEVTILASKRDETTIGIGFATKHTSMARAPGWEPESWGYHGDDGRSFAAQNGGREYGPKFAVGDVIGCGVNFKTGSAFYTKNGQFIDVAFRDIKGKLYPSVGLKKLGDHVRANFGQTPFVFAIDAMVEKERKRIRTEVDETSTANLAPSLDETGLIQQLVLQFLQHDGYVDTARAFADEIQSQKQALSLDPTEQVEGLSLTDDQDANNRQRIRRAILEGDIDRALWYTNKHYPQVLEANEHVYFRLKCRKFIEMIRREAELNLLAEKRAGASNGIEAHDMDLDEGGAAAWVDHMETEDGYNAASSTSDGRDLLNLAIVYGQTLQAEYKDNPRREVKKTLEEIFALVAYINPLKAKEVAHLLDRKGRVAVAEELNSAILSSLGKSERAALENLWAQTTVLLEELRQEGGPGAFVTIQGVVDQIPNRQT
ncbi:hypothetical protein RB595_002445 [Gaeumannomyces hyphopodioides]